MGLRVGPIPKDWALRTGQEALADKCVAGSDSDCEGRGSKGWGTQGMSTHGA